MQGALTVLFENRHDSLGKYPTPMNIAERVRKRLLSVEQALILVDQDRQHIQQLTRQASQQWEGQEGEALRAAVSLHAESRSAQGAGDPDR